MNTFQISLVATPWLMAFAILLSTTAVAQLPAANGDEFVASRLVGRVIDEAGRPIAGAIVLINRTAGARIDGSLPKTTTDLEGRYELTVRFARGKTLAVHEAFADARGYVRGAPALQLRWTGGETGQLSMTLKQGEIFAGAVRVPLTDLERLSRQKAEQIQRFLEFSGPGLDHLPINARSHFTEPGGRFEFWLPPGEYRVRMHGYSQSPVEWTGLKSGHTNHVLDLPGFAWTEANVGKVFDDLWATMDRHYSYFFLKPAVDWAALKRAHRPKAVQARNARELAAALHDLLEPLRDLHVWIETPQETMYTGRATWNYNGNFLATLNQMEQPTDCGWFAYVGRTKGDGFGCFVMNRQSEATTQEVQQAVVAIQALADAPGFLVDLRRANGGSEPLAKEIARLFCAKETVYAKYKYRNGPGHGDFGPEAERLLPASPQPYTRPVVCLIGPGAVSSGEGFVKMMKCLPHVVTVGLPTRGASGNPKPWPLRGTGVTVYFSRWVDLMPDGRTFESVGMAPDVEVNEPAEAYSSRDPTLEKALELLRAKVAAARDSRPIQ